MKKKTSLPLLMVITMISALHLEANLDASVPKLPKIATPTVTATDHGIVGDGTTLNTAAIQSLIDATVKSGGGTIIFPEGNYLTGPLTLGSGLRLRLSKGAVLKLSDDMATYPQGKDRYQNGFAASDAHDIEIDGEGTIDGQGAKWWAAFPAHAVVTGPHRPYLVCFSRCERVAVRGIHIINSPSFHLVPGGCHDVTIDGVTINAPGKSPNTDGIDPSGTDYLIEKCLIDVGDDNIAIKPAGADGPNRHFVITGCDFRQGHGMSIGSGSNGGLDGLTVTNCTFEGTTAGIRIKTCRGRGGLVQNATYDGLTMSQVKTAIEITDYYPKMPATPDADPAQPVTPETPSFANVVIRNVTATDSATAGTIWGLPEAPITGITLSHVTLSAAKGFQLVHAHDIHFDACTVTVTKGERFTLSDAQATGIDK